MSFVGEREVCLVVDILLGRRPEDDLFRELHTSRDEVAWLGLGMLWRALREQCSAGVEVGMFIGYRWGFSPEHSEVLLQLALETWHRRHEDIVSTEILESKARERLAELARAAESEAVREVARRALAGC